jgi:restriction system protein
MYDCTISNQYLEVSKTLKSGCLKTLTERIHNQIFLWANQELKLRLGEAKDQLVANSFRANEQAKETIRELENVLRFTLTFDDKINWNGLYDTKVFQQFSFRDPPLLALPLKPAWTFLPFVKTKWIRMCQIATDMHDSQVNQYSTDRTTARSKYDAAKTEFIAAQANSNAVIKKFKEDYENGDTDAVLEYLNLVMERSEYPACLALTYEVEFVSKLRSAAIHIIAPDISKIPDSIGVKHSKVTGKSTAIPMKKKEHENLYRNIIRQISIRTLHEIFESDYAGNVDLCTVSIKANKVCTATGIDQEVELAAVKSKRKEFESIKLENIEIDSCFERLAIEGKSPVKLLKKHNLNLIHIADDDLELDVNASRPLPKRSDPWHEFRERVLELAAKMFRGGILSAKNTDEKSRAYSFIVTDMDPIRGGQFLFRVAHPDHPIDLEFVESACSDQIKSLCAKSFLFTPITISAEISGFCRGKSVSLIDRKSLGILEEEYYRKKQNTGLR